MGRGQVIHFTGESKLSAGIVKTSLWVFCEEDVSNLYRVVWHKKNDPHLVVGLAESLLEAFSSNEDFRRGYKYHLVTNNCEHFATACKIGKFQSVQVQTAGASVAALSVVIGTAVFLVPGGAAVAAGILAVGLNASKIASGRGSKS